MQLTATDPKCDGTVFVGRQPILDRDKQVFGYELLFRDNTARNVADRADSNATDQTTQASLNVMGLDELVGEARAFINITKEWLLREDYLVLPKERTVIELLEGIEPEPQVLEACRALKDAGYLLALDDFACSDGFELLLDLADIAKVDFRATTVEQRALLTQQLARHGVQLVAEKVETPAEYDEAMQLGHAYFQGFFFCVPQIVRGKEVPAAQRSCLRLLQELSQPELDFGRLEELIKSDVSLAYKLLRYLNSASIGLRHEITSIKQAMVMLGGQPLRKWISLVAMSSVNTDKPSELMAASMIRARFCELIAEPAGLRARQSDLFMMGLLSLLDTLLDRPMGELLSPMLLPSDVKATLAGAQTPLGNIYALAVARERADWERAIGLSREVGLQQDAVDEAHRESVIWSQNLLSQ